MKHQLNFKDVTKVTGDSLLIHEVACSLFISLCSNMTGYSHSYHSVKLIHCGAPQRDVLSDKMVFWMVTRVFYFMLCQSSLLSTVISFVYKDKWWFDESMSSIFCIENTSKRIYLTKCFSPDFTWSTDLKISRLGIGLSLVIFFFE